MKSTHSDLLHSSCLFSHDSLLLWSDSRETKINCLALFASLFDFSLEFDSHFFFQIDHAMTAKPNFLLSVLHVLE